MQARNIQAQQEIYDETLGHDFVRNYLLEEGGHLNNRYQGMTYYRVPPIKHSDYRMKTAISFFSEGLAGASQLLGTILSYAGRERDRDLIGAARYIALAGGIIAPSVFIADLHTRRRWFNMLRIFKRTSVMSIGTWSLSLFGIFSAVTAASQSLKGLGFPLVGESIAKIFQVPAAVNGVVISLYMGAELESTATPAWSAEYPLLPALFAADATANALAAMEIAAEFRGAHPTTRRRLDDLAVLTGFARLGLGSRVDRLLSRKGSDSFLYGELFRYGVTGAGVIVPVGIRLVQLVSGSHSRLASVAAAILTLAGGFLFPMLLLLAGNRSVNRPENYFEQTKPAAAIQQSGRAASKQALHRRWRLRRKRAMAVAAFFFASLAVGSLIAVSASKGR